MAITVGHLQVKIDADGSGVARGVSQAESSLKGLEHSAGRVGSVMQGVFMGVGVAAFGGIVSGVQGAVSAFSGFEQTMSEVKAVSGATAQEFAGLSALAMDMGKKTSFSAKEAASGIAELVKGGVSIPDVMGGATEAMLNLAAAGGVSLPEAAEISANAMSLFNLKGKDMEGVVNKIAGVALASTASVGDFRMSLNQVGGVAKLVGFSFGDTAVAIAKMAESGYRGSDAGTSLKTMMMNLQPSTKAQTAMFQQLGIVTADGANQFFDASGKVKSLADVSEVLKSAVGGLTPQMRTMALETMFGTDAIRAAAVMAESGAEGINTMASAMDKVSAADVAAERLNNLSGSVEQMKGSAETLAITVGSMLAPALRVGADAVTGMLNSAISGVENLQGVLTTTGDARESFLQKLGLDEGAAAAVGTFMDTTQRRIEEGVRDIRGVITSTGGDRAGFLESLGLTQQQATEAGALLDQIQGSFKTLGTSIQTVWDAAKPIVTGIVDGLTKALGGMGGQGSVNDLALLQGALEAVNRELKIFAADLERSKQQQDQQGPGFTKIFDDLDKSLIKSTSASHQMGTILRGELIEIGEVARATWITMSANAGQGFSTLGGDVKMIFEGIGETVRTVFVASAAVIGGFLHGLEEGFSAAGRQIGRFFELLKEGDISGAVTAFSNIGSALQDGFRAGFESREREITEGVNSFFTGIGTSIATTGEAITNSINSVMDSSAKSAETNMSALGQAVITNFDVASETVGYHGEQWNDLVSVIDAAAADASAAVESVGAETQLSVAAAQTALAQYQGDVSGWAAANQSVVAEGTQQWTTLASEWPDQAWAVAQGGLATYQSGLSGFLEQNGAAIVAATPFWQQALTDWLSTATAQAEGYFSTYFAMVVSTMGNLTTAMQGIAQGAWIAALSDWVPTATAQVTSGLSAMVSSMLGILAGAAGSLRAAGTTMGAAVVQGFMAGFESQKGAAEAAVSAWAGRVSAAARAELAVQSPSKVFAEIGSETVAGFNQGIVAAIPSSVAAVEQWATILLDRIERDIYDLGSHFRLDEVGDGWNRAGALLMESFSAGFGGNVGRLTEEASNVLNMLRHMIAERTEEFEDVGDLVALSFQAGVAGRQGDWLATVRVGLSALEEEAARRAANFEDVGDLIGMAFGLGFGDSHTEMTQVFAGQLDDLEREVYERRENFQSAGDVLAKAMQLGLDAAGTDIGQTFMQNIADGIAASAGVVQAALFAITGRVADFLESQNISWFGEGDPRAAIRAQAGLLEHEGSAVMADAMNKIALHTGEVFSEGAQESLDKARVKISLTLQRGQLQIADDLDNALAKAMSDLQKNLAEAGEKAGEGAAKAVAAAHRKFNEAVEKGATGAALAKHQLTLEQDLREAAEKSGEAGEKGVRDAHKKYDEARAAAYGKSDNEFRRLQQQAVLSEESAIESAAAATTAAAIAANKKAAEKIAEEAKKQAEKLATAQSHLAMTPEIIAAGWAVYQAEVIKEGRVVNTAVLDTLTADFLGKAETELAQVGETAAETQMRAYKERGIKDATAAAEAIEKAQAEAKKKATAKADKDAALSLDQFRSTQTYGFNVAQAQAAVEASRPQWELVGRKVSEFVAVGAAAGGEDIARRTMVAVTNPHAWQAHQPALEGVGKGIVTTVALGAGANGEDVAKRAVGTIVTAIVKELPAAAKAGGIAKAGQELGETFGLSAGKSAATTMLGTMANEINNPANRRKLGGAVDDLGMDLAGRLHKGMVHGTGTGKDKVWDPIYGAYFGDPEWKAIVAQGILDGKKAFDAAQERIWFFEPTGTRQGKMGGVQGLDGPGFDAAKEWSRDYMHGISTSEQKLGMTVEKALEKADVKAVGKQAGEDYASELTGAVRQIMGQFNPFSGARNLADLWAGYIGMGALATGTDGQKSFAEMVYDWRKANPYGENMGIGGFEMPGRGGTADDIFKSTFNYDRETKSYPGPGNSSLPGNYGGINSRNAGEPGNINITLNVDGKVLAEVLLDRMGGKMNGMY